MLEWCAGLVHKKRMGWEKGLRALLFSVCSLWLVGASHKAEAQCLEHTIWFKQNADQYLWKMDWKTGVSFDRYEKFFTWAASQILLGNSEVVTKLEWIPKSPRLGTSKATVKVLGNDKTLYRQCEITDDAVFCQLDTKLGNGGEHINWAWSKILCSDKACQYQEAGSIKSAAPFASAATLSVGINTQSMKDVLRLAIASELGAQNVNRAFGNSRNGPDEFWKSAQMHLKKNKRDFEVSSASNCR